MRIGLEIFKEEPGRWLETGSKVGLLYNTASIDGNYRFARDVAAAIPEITLTTLFGPQHGVNSDVQDNMIETSHGLDPVLSLPVWSLYAEKRKPTAEMLKGLDALLIDLPDVGTRVYTFIWTMKLAMEACGECGVNVIVLDRPNPIGGLLPEGNLLEMEFSSFVGLLPIPMRHSLTVGELARWFVAAGHVSCDLTVVKAQGWKREDHHPATGFPWAMPSPNMPAYDTALVYPGTVLLEGTNGSEGRGTTRPFEIIGVPWGKPEELARFLNRAALPGVYFRPLTYVPTFHKWSGQTVKGVFIHVTDKLAFKPYLTGLFILSALWRLYRDDGFVWRQPPYEYEEVKLPIHLLLGSERLREALEQGADPRDLEAGWQVQLNNWKKDTRSCLLY